MDSLSDKLIKQQTDGVNYVEVEGVRITPKALNFDDAFESRKYIKTITIQNCGRKAANIRIVHPTSRQFHIKTLIREKYLPPGLKITKRVSYTYSQFNLAHVAVLPIIVNGIDVAIKLQVTVSLPFVSVDRCYIDFGMVNIGSSSPMETIYLKNEGSMLINYAIDTQNDTFQIIVNPKQGRVLSKSVQTLHWQVLGYMPGKFEQQAWVRSRKPLLIKIRCEFIRPELRIYNLPSTSDFFLISFPFTYFGETCEKYIIVKNYNCKSAMFCLLGEWKQELYNLNVIAGIDEEMQHFSANVQEGRIFPHEGMILCLRYKPIYLQEYEKDHGMVYNNLIVLQLVRLDCQDITQYVEATKNLTYQSEGPSEGGSASFYTGGSSNTLGTVNEISAVGEQEDVPTLALESYIRFMVHGLAEKATVSVLPDNIIIDSSIEISKKVERVLRLTNNSKHLPVTVEYVKSSFVDVFPPTYELKSLESLEVRVVLKPYKLGDGVINIKFNLVHNHNRGRNFNVGNLNVQMKYHCVIFTKKKKPIFNMGITPLLLNEVGIFAEDVKFNTTAKLPRAAVIKQDFITRWNDDMLIAFPNDRPRSLRPTTTLPACTIFKRMPRYVDSEISKPKSEPKYRSNFVEKNARCKEISIKLPPITNGRSQIEQQKGSGCALYSSSKDRRKLSALEMIPLTPLQLFNIKVTPRRNFVGKVAEISTINQKVEVYNGNDFPIDAMLRYYTPYIRFLSPERETIKGGKSAEFVFLFTSGKIPGFFQFELHVVINDSVTFEVSLSGETVPRTLIVDRDSFEFKEVGPMIQYLDIHNPFSANLSFSLENPLGCFEVEPSTGVIDPQKHIIVVIKYQPVENTDRSVDIIMNCDGKMIQSIRLQAERAKTSVSFDPPQLDFGEIPLNMLIKKYVILNNYSHLQIQCEIVDNAPYSGVKASLTETIIHKQGQIMLVVEVQIQERGEFYFDVCVKLQKKIVIALPVTGHAIFPVVKISPNLLKFRKITNFSSDRVLFLLENTSKVDAVVRFNVDDYKEFTLSQSLNPLDNVERVQLGPYERKQLCLHFDPIDVSLHSFILGLTVNGVSYSLSNPDASPNSQSSTLVLYAEQSPMNTDFPIVKVFATVTQPCISFSRTTIQFRYYPHPNFPNSITEDFVITNMGQNVEEFCLRWDELQPPFFLTVLDEDMVERGTFSISSALQPGEQRRFVIRFHASNPGDFKCKLPVYVKGQMDGAIYKIIYISGNYPAPSLEDVNMIVEEVVPEEFPSGCEQSVNHDIVYLEPVPLKTISTTDILELRTKFHVMVCTFNFETTENDLRIECNQNRLIDPRKLENKFNILITFSASSPTVIESKVKIYCKCGAECSFMVKACSENCSITTHAFLSEYCGKTINLSPSGLRSTSRTISEMQYDLDVLSVIDVANLVEVAVNTNDTCFPYFPEEADVSFYANHMRATLNSIERWINNCNSNIKMWYSIPDGMTSEVSLIRDKRSTMKVSTRLPYLALLRNLAGPGVCHQLLTNSRSNINDDIKLTKFLIHIYSDVKKMLQSAGALLPNIEPEYLITYEQYVIYVTKISTSNYLLGEKKKKCLTFEKFRLLSKQNWIDLLLQTYKVFQMKVEGIYNSIKYDHPREILTYFTSENMRAIVSAKSSLYDNSLYHPVENMLLYWLESIYNNYRETLVEGVVLPEKFVKLFDLDLYDGTVLAVATMVYCPYMKSEFADFYWHVESQNEIIYNASKLCIVFEKLQCSFKLRPYHITSSNTLEMLMFVVNLYDFLPHMWPAETMTLYCPLAKKREQIITITNENVFPLKFSLHFFKNEHTSFVASVKSIVVSPKHCGRVEVTYSATQFREVEAYLLFSGESEGFHLARNRVYRLVGVPLVHVDSNLKLTIRNKNFEYKEVVFKIQSPHKCEGEHDIYMFYTEPDANSDRVRWMDIRRRHKIARRIVILDDTLVCDNKGMGQLTIVAASFGVNYSTCWLLFKCDGVGEFFAQIEVLLKMTATQGSIQIGINRRVLESHCICGLNRDPFCPKNITVNIPANVPKYWSCFLDLLEKSLNNPSDMEFWRKYSHTYAGICIWRRKVHDYPTFNMMDFGSIFHTLTSYEIKILDNEHIEADKVIDVHHLDYKYLKLTFHVNSDCVPDEFNFSMISKISNLKRNYKCNFVLCD